MSGERRLVCRCSNVRPTSLYVLEGELEFLVVEVRRRGCALPPHPYPEQLRGHLDLSEPRERYAEDLEDRLAVVTVGGWNRDRDWEAAEAVENDAVYG